MSDLRITWGEHPGRYTSGQIMFVGRVKVAEDFWDSVRRGDDPYRVSCLLPGTKRLEERFETLEMAKARAEALVRAWFRWTQEERAP